ncbi:MAG: SMP-30/gluconolactonase/LRE family protein [Chitinophagaceae bacterium]|nr:SMP-30/gluconolactonase/LRE family protein [Rubrivivax sp.]
MTPNDLPMETRRAERVGLPHPTLTGLHAWRVGNRVGEAPCWDAETQCLLWVDIRATAVLRLNPGTATLTTWRLPEVVGAMGLAQPGSVLLALQRSLALLDLETGQLTRLHDATDEPENNRLNDGKVSPSGRWFVFGSMDDSATDKQPSGALYVASRQGPLRRLWQGLTVANGIAFSPDGGTLYFSDSFAGRIWHAAWNETEGLMGTPQLLCISDEAAGRPDGAAVDAQGSYWSAGVSAGCINRFAADGRPQEKMAVPCRAPTMPCFGGPHLHDVYVTSLVRAGWVLSPDQHDGDVLSFSSPVPGLPTARWR